MARAIRIEKRRSEPSKEQVYREYMDIWNTTQVFQRGDVETLGLENMFLAELEIKGTTFKKLHKAWPDEKLSDVYLAMLIDFGGLVQFNDKDPKLKKMEQYCNTESKFRLFSYMMVFNKFRPQLYGIGKRNWGSRNLIAGITHSSDSSVGSGLEAMVSGNLLRRFQDPSYGETQAAYFYTMTSTGHQELYDSVADIETLDKPENTTKDDLWRGRKYAILLDMYGNKIQNIVKNLRKKKAIERITGKYEGETRYHVRGEGKMNIARRVVENAEKKFYKKLQKRRPPYKIRLVGL